MRQQLPACLPPTACPYLLPLAPAGYSGMAPSSGPSNDVAMLALASPSVASTVVLTSGSPGLAAGETVWAAGFGVTETGETSTILR